MEFYTKFSEHYDYIFPFQIPQFNFLKESIKSGDKVLDLACGTGNYITEICRNFDVQGIGIDLDSGMIEKAQGKGARLNNLNFYSKDMLDITSFSHSFDLIYCIGNSLPHLVDPQTIYAMLQKIYDKLNANGLVVLQTVNYDKRPSSLKTIVNHEKNLEFVRTYNYRNEIVEFHTILKGEDFEVQGKVDLYPLLSVHIKKMLTDVGFKSIKMYGSFNKEKFDPENSGSLVVEARK